MTDIANVDPLEIAKFDEQSDGWWDPDGAFRPLHELNPVRLQWIDAQARLAGSAVLDVGCGGGILAESMARRAASVLGIDLSPRALDAAKSHALESGVGNVAYREVPVEVLAGEQASCFDVVTCMEMLEHVPQPAAVVQACAQLVRPGGWVMFATIHRTPQAFAAAIVAAEHVLRLLPKGTHEYARFIRPSELSQWARAAGLEPRGVTGVRYNPITRRAQLHADCSVNYMISFQRAGMA